MHKSIALVCCLLLVFSGALIAQTQDPGTQQPTQQQENQSTPAQQNQAEQPGQMDRRDDVDRTTTEETTIEQDIEVRDQEETSVDDPDALPATASPLALLALIGLGSLGGAAVVRRLKD